MSTFIISTSPVSIIGYVQNPAVASEKAGKNLVIKDAEDLISLGKKELSILQSLVGVTDIDMSKVDIYSTFDIMSKSDFSNLVQLDKNDSNTINTKAKSADGKVRKVRDSKLQRMAAAFRQQDENGQYKVWTIKELMEACGKPGSALTERIANVYISILRAQNDRFVMNIVKNKENGTFQYQPKPKRQ